MSTSITIIVAVLQRLVGDDAHLTKLVTDLQAEINADEAAEKALEVRVACPRAGHGAGPVRSHGDQRRPSTPGERLDTLEATPPSAPDLTALTDRVTALENRNAGDDSAAGSLGGGTSDPTTIIPGPLNPATATVGEPYSAIITASGGVPPLQFSIASGALPDGLSLSGGGAVSGTPTAAGDFVFGVQVHDANNNVGNAIFTLTVAEAAGTPRPMRPIPRRRPLRRPSKPPRPQMCEGPGFQSPGPFSIGRSSARSHRPADRPARSHRPASRAPRSTGGCAPGRG
jgi:hypothetical protein